jgi:hypothetical protein
MDSVLSFDLKETRIRSLMPKPPDKLEGPSALALTDRKLYVLNMTGNRVSTIGRQTLEPSPPDKCCSHDTVGAELVRYPCKDGAQIRGSPALAH